MQAQYEMKVQVIRSKGRATRLFVNVPLPLAAALDLQAGERVRWQLLARSDLRLIRLNPTPAKKTRKR
jgi:hypothetical protein